MAETLRLPEENKDHADLELRLENNNALVAAMQQVRG